MTDPETGMVPVQTILRTDDLPADLGNPRKDGWRVGDIAGIVTGGVLLALTVALFLYATLNP